MFLKYKNAKGLKINKNSLLPSTSALAVSPRRRRTRTAPLVHPRCSRRTHPLIPQRWSSSPPPYPLPPSPYPARGIKHFAPPNPSRPVGAISIFHPIHRAGRSNKSVRTHMYNSFRLRQRNLRVAAENKKLPDSVSSFSSSCNERTRPPPISISHGLKLSSI